MENIIANIFTLSLEQRIAVIEMILGNFNDKDTLFQANAFIDNTRKMQEVS